MTPRRPASSRDTADSARRSLTTFRRALTKSEASCPLPRIEATASRMAWTASPALSPSTEATAMYDVGPCRTSRHASAP
jgi:hypothetical protein